MVYLYVAAIAIASDLVAYQSVTYDECPVS